MPRTNPPKRKKGMLKGISFDEVSFVGKGANQGAHVSIIKMDDPKEISKRMFSEIPEERLANQKFRDFAQLLYNEQSALMEAVDSVMYSGKEDKKQAIFESLQQFVQTFTSTVNDTDVIKSLEGLSEALGGKENPAQEVDTVNKTIELLKAWAESLDDEQKEIYKGLSEDEQGEILKAAAKDKAALEAKFKAMAEEKKKKGMKKADTTVTKGAGDESFQMEDGTVVAKSVVGDAAFLMLKGMNARLEKAENETAKAQEIAKQERDARILKELSEEAEKLWPNLPGTAIEKGKVLQSIRSLPEDLQKAQMEMMNSGNASNASLFKEYGGQGGEAGSAEEKLKKMAEDHASKTGLTFHKAYSAVIDTPEGQKLYEQTLN